MRSIGEIAPWETHSLGSCPWEGFWAFNPSAICTPDGRWLCSIRCANYHLPGSTLAPEAKPARLRNRNLMVTLDPETWRVTNAVEMIDMDRARGAWRSDPGFGFEDLRLMWTERDGLFAIGNSLALNDAGMLEICRLALDEDFQIVGCEALRGSSWSAGHQKNWSGYQYEASSRFLYSITEGGVHDRNGRMIPMHKAPALCDEDPPEPEAAKPAVRSIVHRNNGAMEVVVGPARGGHRATPRKAGLSLRGGTQLLPIGPGAIYGSTTHVGDRWLGLAHGCRVSMTKMYWHRWIVVDHDGALLAISDPFKIDESVGIEFAAGLAASPQTLADGRGPLVVSYGIEDDSAHLGITELSAVMELVHEVPAPARAPIARRGIL